MRRPDDSCLRTDQADVARYAQSQPDSASASNDELIAVARSMAPWTERMMHHLLSTSSAAGISRSMLERTVASLGDAGLENRLTAGLGTIESAEPPRDAWQLGRLVARDARLTAVFDEGLDGLDARLRTGTGTAAFVTELDAFSAARRRGPDEWELASPTWGSDPAIALAMIDRLRHAPEERDPVAVSTRLAVERVALIPEIRRRLPRWRRPLFDVAMRATTAHTPNERRRRLRSSVPCTRLGAHSPSWLVARVSSTTTSSC